MTTDQSKIESSFSWEPIQKPAEIAETRLINAIINSNFPINSHLPGERELAELLGVTRPTLREALQRLARDGWVEIHQGKPTRVCDYWREGKLGVLNALSEHVSKLPENFIANLLNVRLAMAPAYTELAVANSPQDVIDILEPCQELAESPVKFAHFDWRLQHGLTILGENPIFVMILNGFKSLFLNLAPIYFNNAAARRRSSQYYEALNQAAIDKDASHARTITEDIMRESLLFWQQTHFN